jgi:3' terminal RNA ribose 2'-O-methyltransferase Hen1
VIVLLTISTTHVPATDLGYLLHKHPGRVQSFAQSVGTAHVFYPETADTRCSAALLLEVDPIALVRGRSGPAGDGFALGQYVNDRPYAASSMLAMALKDVFRTALTGRCNAQPELAATPIPLEISIPAVPCRGGADLLQRLFEPLGWRVAATGAALDPQIPEWGASRYFGVQLTGELVLADALNHLYVLLPVLDDAKHYWVTSDEVDKLIRAGSGWLAGHPEKELITHRYLAHRRGLTRSAMARLAEVDDTDPDELDNAIGVEDGTVVDGTVVDVADADVADRPVSLADQRRGAVLAAVRACGARTVADLGCGEGALIGELLADRSIESVVAADVSVRALQIAARKLHLETLPESQRARLTIFQSALTYRDDRLAGLDAAVLMEVIEHVDQTRLPALERVVFGYAAPGTVIVTTPNAEHNVRFETLAPGAMRHRDHRFEWTRPQFRAWADAVGTSYGYSVRHFPVGADDPEVGPPTQLAILTRAAAT